MMKSVVMTMKLTHGRDRYNSCCHGDDDDDYDDDDENYEWQG